MFGKHSDFALAWRLPCSHAAAAVEAGAGTKLTAAEIVNRNVAARGGLQAWRVNPKLNDSRFAGPQLHAVASVPAMHTEK